MRLGVLASVIALALPGTAAAVNLTAVPGGGGFSRPVNIAAPSNAPQATLYIVEQSGLIWRLHGGSRALFLDISDLVSTGGSEQGLFSIAFDPKYASNRFFYVDYTDLAGDTRVMRYKADPTFAQADESTARQALAIHQPYPTHNGGQLAFGPNGRLYVGMGDGGAACDPENRAQNLRSRLGKLLSFNPRNPPAGWRIDAYGLRNPWRFSFDRGNGRLYLGDVGQDNWEEIDTLSAGELGNTPENFGWNVYEGAVLTGYCPTTGLKGPGRLIQPINHYGHTGNCAVIGGFAYRGKALTSFRGSYFFGDFCSGKIWQLRYTPGHMTARRRLVLDTDLNISSFGQGVLGELYVSDYNGTIYKLTP
jgi:glucose/arabinose dehydrogenase